MLKLAVESPDICAVPMLIDELGRGDGEELANYAEYVCMYHLLKSGTSLVLDLRTEDDDCTLSAAMRELMDDIFYIVEEGALDDVTVVPFVVSRDRFSGRDKFNGGIVRIDFEQPFSLKVRLPNN